MPDFDSVLDATESAVAAAGHLTDMDDGAVQALRALALKIDTDAAVREAYLDYSDENDLDRKPLQLDNVSIPTYLKYCESLGLTPAGRLKFAEKKPEESGGKLANLKSVPKPKRTA